MSANILLKYPSGFISLKAQEKSGLAMDYALDSEHMDHDVTSFEAIALNVTRSQKQPKGKYLQGAGLMLALLGHALLLYLLVYKKDIQQNIQESASPITVSIIAPPAPEPVPEPELVPVIKPEKPAKKTVIKPKKVVEKIVPVENVEQPLIEATTEPVFDNMPEVEEVAVPEVEQTAAPAPPRATEIEEVIEQPKFGVAYLNNPAPNYPRLSRKIGEEGRVLLKVLVSEQGAANTVEVEKSSGYTRLDESAVDAVKRWKFIPARKGAQALSAYVLVPISFALD